MKNDIDFDELDKAVTSLMGTVNEIPAEGEDPKPKTLSINETLTPDEKPTYDKLGEVAKTIGSETLVPSEEKTVLQNLDPGVSAQPSSPAPSSPEPTPVAPAPLLPVAAPSPVVGPVVPEVKDPSIPPVVSPPVTPRPSVTATPRPTGGRFMDVVHPSSDMRAQATDVSVPLRPTPPIVPVASQPEVAPKPVVSTPIPEGIVTTPFLPDAKVEKRPLGGVTDSSEESTTSTPEEPTSPFTFPASDQDDQLNKQSVLDATNFNQRDADAASIQAIESSDTGTLSSQGTLPAEPPVTQPTIPAAVASVKALDHPAKQKSGWGVVIIILIVILLAAALGAAAYFILGLSA